MRKNNNIKYTYKQIGVITFPILISLLMEMMIGITDTAFLGRVGEIELGASAISGVFYLIIFMVAFGFSVGAQILAIFSFVFKLLISHFGNKLFQNDISF